MYAPSGFLARNIDCSGRAVHLEYIVSFSSELLQEPRGEEEAKESIYHIKLHIFLINSEDEAHDS